MWTLELHTLEILSTDMVGHKDLVKLRKSLERLSVCRSLMSEKVSTSLYTWQNWEISKCNGGIHTFPPRYTAGRETGREEASFERANE